jgi:hypothetical protein
MTKFRVAVEVFTVTIRNGCSGVPLIVCYRTHFLRLFSGAPTLINLHRNPLPFISPNSGDLTMSNSVVKGILVCSLCLSIAPGRVHAQETKKAKTPAQDPSSYMHVSAPLAQAVLVKVKAKHDDIVKLGLHAVPPGETDNVIIANITPSKIGKKSSPKDLEKLAKQTPIAVRVDKDQIFDLLIPITDAHGGDLDGGFIVMEVPYAKAGNEEEALKIGVPIRDEVQRQIPSKTAMYQQ